MKKDQNGLWKIEKKVVSLQSEMKIKLKFLKIFIYVKKCKMS